MSNLIYIPSRKSSLKVNYRSTIYLPQSQISTEANTDGVVSSLNSVDEGIGSSREQRVDSRAEITAESLQNSSRSEKTSHLESEQIKAEAPITSEVEPRVSAVQRRQQALARQKQSLTRGTSSEVV